MLRQGISENYINGIYKRGEIQETPVTIYIEMLKTETGTAFKFNFDIIYLDVKLGLYYSNFYHLYFYCYCS